MKTKFFAATLAALILALACATGAFVAAAVNTVGGDKDWWTLSGDHLNRRNHSGDTTTDWWTASKTAVRRLPRSRQNQSVRHAENAQAERDEHSSPTIPKKDWWEK